MTRKTCKDFFLENWLVLLIAAQPLLDVLAYWTRSEDGTAAGYIRLCVMMLIPLYLLFALKKKKKFIISMLVIGMYCVGHVLNCFRLGYIDPVLDISYLAKIAQLPILAVCFAFLIKDERTMRQALRGIWLAAAITVGCLLLSLVTGTWNSTYGGGLGISGWVIDDNRCANSIIFVTLSVFAIFYAYNSEKKAVQIGVPALTALILVANSTRACYMGLFCIFASYITFALIRSKISGERVKKTFVITLILLSIAAAAVYPYTPRALVDSGKVASAQKSQNEFDEKVKAMGYDLNQMSDEEKLNTPEVFEAFEEYYTKIVGYVIPDMFTRFGTERVLIKYGFETNANKLIDVRRMKSTLGALIWDDCDPVTKLFGFEITQQCSVRHYDMENDWPALFYYTGYLGFGLYVAFVLYFVYLIIRRMIKDFRGSFTAENLALGVCLALQLALAQFSGALIRRPNVSIYFALVLGMIYYKTAVVPISGKESAQ